MARSEAHKRILPTSLELDEEENTVKKVKVVNGIDGDVAVGTRNVSIDGMSDSVQAGESNEVINSANHNNEYLYEDEDKPVKNLENNLMAEITTETNFYGLKTSPKNSTKTSAKSAATTLRNRKQGKDIKVKAKPKAKIAVKRKIRTQKDKEKENAPMSAPFFVETGVDWNNTNIDFDELNTLRSHWELPAACHILWILQSPLTLRFSNTLLEYEAALLKPEQSPVLEDVFTKLLLKKSERACLSAGIGLKYEWWNKQLRTYYLDMYDKWYALLRKAGETLPQTFSDDEDDNDSSISNDKTDEQVDVELTDDEWLTLEILKARLESLGTVCPLKYKSFADLSIDLRCKILLNLCEAVVYDPINTEYMRQMEEDDLRVEPLGNDRAGNLYYFFPQFYEERRLYRLDPVTMQWTLWAKGGDAFRSMLNAMKKIRGRKIRGEQELLNHLEVIVEQIEEEDEVRARQLEKATRLAILEAIPRKRSLRLQVKQLEKMEKHQENLQHRRELSMEEIAEMKRKELLSKLDRDDEIRDDEHEGHREQVEGQEGQTEREKRWLRRIQTEHE